MRDPRAVEVESEFRRRIEARLAAMHDSQGRSPESIEASTKGFLFAVLGIVGIGLVLAAVAIAGAL